MGSGLGMEPVKNAEFDDLAGSWVADTECEEVLNSMRESIDGDLWIASLVIQNDLPLYSRDRHFDHLPQLPRVR